MGAEVVTFKASEALRGRLEDLQKEAGMTRSAAIRKVIMEATVRSGELAVPDEHEVLVLLGQAARAGSVAAMKELRAYHGDRKALPCDNKRDAFSALDDLARRRLERPGDGSPGIG